MNSPAMCDWVFEHARVTPDAPAVDSPEHRLTYGLLARRALAVAKVLREQGVSAGDRVLVALPNVPAAVVVSLAVQHLGAVAAEVSRDLSADQLALVVAQLRPRAIAFAARDARKFTTAAWRERGVRSALVVTGAASLPPSFDRGVLDVWTLTEAGQIQGTPAEDAIPDVLPARDPASVTLLLYTSGSTQTPRAVMQTIANIAANTRSIRRVLELTARDRAMLILPLSYCYGRSVLQTHLFAGGSVFLDPRFTYPRVVLEAIVAERCTGFAGVPLTFELLRRHGAAGLPAMKGLRYVTQAGGAMLPETIDWAREAFAPASLFVMYGQTEATARLSYLPPERARDKRGSIGVPIPNVQLRVVDDAGIEVPVGTSGNVIAHGPNVTPGYLDAADETARILRDGWLWTGDIGRRDDEGFFYLEGRAKELLKVGGHRVAPAQVASILAAHDCVLEAAVVGLPDPLLGEAVGALVVAKPGATPTEKELLRFCGERLPPYLVPRVLRFVASLPRGPSGKIQREAVHRALTTTHDDERRKEQAMVRFSRQVLDFDPEATATFLSERLRDATKLLKRRGVVVALSGGIDSSCVAALAVRSLGAERVFGLMMPERDSSDESLEYAKELARRLGIRFEVTDIAPTLEAVGCYRARDEAVRSVFPALTPQCRWKIVMHGDRLGTQALNVFYVVVETADGTQHRMRLPPAAYLQIVAATNFKQRVRKMLEYYHADRLVFAAAATPNRLEYDQGFFVKLGDGAGDVKPIASLYKTQVYRLAAHLGVPQSIVNRPPTTDTYSLAQSQEEFYFSVPYGDLDLLLWAKNNGVSADAAAAEMGLTAAQVGRVYADIDQKRRTTAYLHAAPMLLEPVPEIAPFLPHLGNAPRQTLTDAAERGSHG